VVRRRNPDNRGSIPRPFIVDPPVVDPAPEGDWLDYDSEYTPSEAQAAAIAGVDSRIEIGGDMVAFTTYPTGVDDPATRNTSAWFDGLDFSCASHANDHYASYPEYVGGVAITPLHVLHDGHWLLAVGDEIAFVTADGNDTVVKRTIVAVTQHPDFTDYYPDLAIATLDSELPATIAPAVILPDDWRDWFPALPKMTEELGRRALTDLDGTRLYRLPHIAFDQQERGHVGEVMFVGQMPNKELWTHFIATRLPDTGTVRRDFYESATAGDCGSPSFLILNDQPVLLNCVSGGYSGSGTSVVDYATWINGVVALSGAYALQRVDLSGYVKA